MGAGGVFGEGAGESFGAPLLQPTQPTLLTHAAERPKPIEQAATTRAADREANLLPRSVIPGRL